MCAFRKGTSGTTLVELLVSVTIVAVLFSCIAPLYLRAGHYESNRRRMALARTALSFDLERIARDVSLASGFDGSTLSYPSECGGVAFETNRVSGVASATFSRSRAAVKKTMTVRDAFDSSETVEERRYAADPIVLSGGIARYAISGFTATNVAESAMPGVVRLVLVADVPLLDSGGREYTNKVEVSRLARMWNK